MLKNKYILDPWSIIEDKFDSSKMVDSESIFSLGNGKIGQRGNFEEDFSEIKPLEITLVVYIIRIKLKLVGGKKDIQITLPKWLIAQTGTALELK